LIFNLKFNTRITFDVIENRYIKASIRDVVFFARQTSKITARNGNIIE
jgi:hypothetical protein